MNKQINMNDLAYEVAKHQIKKQEFDFKTICSEVAKKMNITENEFKKTVGEFYTNLLQDIRFLCLGNNKWTLKEYLSFSEYKNKIKTLYDFDDQVHEIEENEQTTPLVKDVENIEEDIVDNEKDDSRYQYDHEEEITDKFNEEDEIIEFDDENDEKEEFDSEEENEY